MSPKLTEEEKDQRRQQIVTAAIEVFKRKGYEKATLKDIVEEAQMSRGWIYLYYSDKIEIFQAMLDQLDEQMAHDLSELRSKHPSVREALRQFIRNTKDSVASAREGLYPAIYEFFIAGWRDPKVSDYFAERYERTVALFEDFLRSGVEIGEFSSNAPITAISKSLMSAVDGILVHVLAFGSDRVGSELQMDELAERVERQLG